MGLPCLVSIRIVLPVSLGAQHHFPARFPNLAVRGRWLKPIINVILDKADQKLINGCGQNTRFIIAYNRNYRFSDHLLDPLCI